MRFIVSAECATEERETMSRVEAMQPVVRRPTSADVLGNALQADVTVKA